MKPRVPRRPSPAALIASLALFVALGGPAEAARLINGKQIRKGTVASRQVKDRSLRIRDLSRGTRASLRETPAASVGTAQLREGSVGAAQIAPGSVTAAALTADVVTSGSIIDKQVAGVDVADSAITAGKIASGAVRKAELGANAVGTSEVANGTLSGDDIADGSLGAADLADTAGAVDVDFGAAPDNDCASSGAIAAPALKAGEVVTDDVLLVTPPADFPRGYVVSIRAAGDAAVVLEACNVGSATGNPPRGTFRVLGIDAG